MGKTALLTGVTGQDASYLAEYLLERDYEVWGLVVGIEDMTHLAEARRHRQFHLVEGELLDAQFISGLIADLKPNRFFNLAGQSFVPLSWKQPVFTGDFNGLVVTRILEAIRQQSPLTRFYQASSSEMYGNNYDGAPLSESSHFRPVSPYACAKLYAHSIVHAYRQSYGLFAVSGILFNHESSRRGMEFVTQKVAHAAVAMACGCQKELILGNPWAQRDWGWAPDYVRAMTLMLDHDEPDDYVIATGQAHSVQELCDLALKYAGAEDKKHKVIFNDPSLKRPRDVQVLIGDASKARRVLGWEPSVNFEQLVALMITAAQDRHSCHGAPVRSDAAPVRK